MEALILSGGFGTRLRPLTFTCPKPLIPFCNIPIIEHQISALSKANVTKIVLAISNDSQSLAKMKEFIKNCQMKYKIQIVLSIELLPLGTAGPLALARNEITAKNFFVLNSDIICCYPLNELANFHFSHGKEGTILTTKVKNPSRYGIVISCEGLVYKFVEKPQNFIGDNINAGIYCFKRDIFNRIEERNSSIEYEIFPQMACEKQLYCLALPLTNKFWMDIGQPKDYLQGTKDYLDLHKRELIIGKDIRMSREAKLGDHVVLGDNCVIEKGVYLENCVIFSGTIVKENSKVKNSIIGWDCTINEECSLDEFCVLERNVTVEKGAILVGNIVCSHKTVPIGIKTYQIVL